MLGNLARAARHFGLELTGTPVFGWRLRSIGAPVTGPAGPRWLRVVSEFPEWASGEAWTGNVDANALTGVAKPRVLDVTEWHDDDEWRRQRAEVMTFVPCPACAPERELRRPVNLSDGWWTELRTSLDALAVQPTERVGLNPELPGRRMLAFFGTEVDLGALPFVTAHCDLQWSNLTAPECVLLDWEHWGTAPAGYDAALLYCTSLLRPEVAERVHATFADLLDPPEGHVVQLAAVARLLYGVEQGDHPDLAGPLHAHARALLKREH